MSESTRQLAAILFADIVGYTSLMGEDEDRAFRVLNQFKSIAKPLIEEHKGKWHKDLGDGALCSFGSTLDAVKGAIATQQLLNKGTDIKVRIGIHLGDVTFQNGDVFGDGVNIASRIQSEAAPGGICLSEPVFKSVRNKEGVKVGMLGKRKLKNVDGLTKLYQVSVPGVETKSRTPVGVISIWKAAIISVGLMGLTGLSVWNTMRGNAQRSLAVERQDLLLPIETPVALIGSAHFGGGQTAIAISPDGDLIVYAGQEGQTTRLFLRSMDSYEVRSLEGTQGAYMPFFSPDGEWIGFISNNYLKKTSVRGGTPITLCETSNPSGAVWSSNNRIYISDNEGVNINWIDSEGGEKQELEVEGFSGKTIGSFNNPSLIMDKYLLVSPPLWTKGIYAISIANGQSVKLLDRGDDPQYLPSGHLTFVEQGRLLVVPFDSKTLSVKGKIVSIIDDLRTEDWCGQIAVSKEGTLIYVPGISASKSELVYRSIDGDEEVISSRSDYYGECSISPDGNRLSISNRNTMDISIYEINTQRITRLTNNGDNYGGIWTSDGKELAYGRNSTPLNKIIKLDVQGSGTPIELINNDNAIFPEELSNDGRILMYTRSDPKSSMDIRFHYLGSEGKEDIVLMPNGANEYLPSFSPDDNYVAYTSNESGQSEVYVQPFPPTGDRWTISSGGGEEPKWSPKEDKLYYRNKNDWMEVSFTTEPTFSAGKPKLLFSGPYINVPGYSYDIHPDGDRFLLIRPVTTTQTATRLKVVKNWFEEVKRLAPVE